MDLLTSVVESKKFRPSSSWFCLLCFTIAEYCSRFMGEEAINRGTERIFGAYVEGASKIKILIFNQNLDQNDYHTRR